MATSTFVFDPRASCTKVTEEQILDGLRRFAAHRGGKRFLMREFNAWPERPCNANTVISRLGGWRAALLRAGLAAGRPAEYTPVELVETLERVWKKLGRPPGKNILERVGGVTYRPYVRRWGSVARACERIAAFHRGKITRKELLRAEPRMRHRVPASVRWQVLERDGFRCVGCGASPKAKKELHVDHIVPKSKGGSDRAENLRTLCRRCNLGRGNRD